MRIALVNYEFPPGQGLGGIGTYALNAANMLQARGHDVTVFCAGIPGQDELVNNGARVHRISATAVEFSDRAADLFSEQHRQIRFDVVEGTDFGADGSLIKRRFLRVPMVVKLHTPRYLIARHQGRELSLLRKLRFAVGALRRGRLPILPKEDGTSAREIACIREADELAAPSKAIGDRIAEDLCIPANRFSLVPYPYLPSPRLLQIPPGGNTQRVTFIGRLEVRKGVIDLADAIHEVVCQAPQVRFRFLGRSAESPVFGVSMADYLQERLRQCRGNVEFVGEQALSMIPQFLAETDICVFPSHWESFGLVCCEAMAAARAVVGSAAGGMAEIIQDGISGILVTPKRPDRIAHSLLKLLGDSGLRKTLGAAARHRILKHFNAARIGLLQEESYLKAIEQCGRRAGRESRPVQQPGG